MAPYIYLLENRLSGAQRSALLAVRELARQRGLTVFLVGGAVRDLTSGSPVRDLDLAVQGNALKLKKDLEKIGAVVMGEYEPLQSLFLAFPGSVRMEISSTLSVQFPKPGKPVAKPSNILDDLRRRDFTANAMALSLNEGSYGLLMDPLNGVADIENRQLRLVSNYGFIEDPVRAIRAARLMARLGWTLDEKTETRYQTAKQEGYISALSAYYRGYEVEEIFYEEDPLRILKRLEAEGWMKFLAPFWNAGKVNVAELERLRDAQTQLQMQGIHPDTAAANFPMLTAKLSAKEIASLKGMFARRGFVADIERLESDAKEFAGVLGGKAGAAASQAWKLIVAAKPEVVLWTIFSSKSAPLQAKFKSFSSEWPQVRSKIPYALMQEMRITPDLPGYEDLLETLFFQFMDGKLTTTEEIKAFLEPYSPPAPPPPVSLRRPRAAKKETRSKARASKVEKVEDEAEDAQVEVPAVEAEAPVVAPEVKPVKVVAKAVAVKAVAVKAVPAKAAPVKTKPAPVVAKPVAPSAKPAAKVAAPKVPVALAKKVAAKSPVKAVAKKVVVKAPTPPARKVASKAPVKVAKKVAPVKAAKKVVGKKAAKR